MRHDPAAGAIIIMLRSLKMYGMAQAVTDLIEQGAPAFEAAIPMLSQLLKAELAEREVRSIAYHMKSARFPAYKDLAGFDFAASEVNEATVRTLHRCEVMGGAQNVVLIGGPGTGKTHVATALGIQAIEHHRRKVRFFSTIEMVNALEQEKAKGKAGQIAEGMTRLDLVILDELGYLPFSASGGALLFHLLSKLADTAYGAGEMLGWLVDEQGIDPHIPVFDKTKRSDGAFPATTFSFDPEANEYTCPGGKKLKKYWRETCANRRGR